MLALTTSYHTEKSLQKEKSLYKFIWVRKGSITLEIDHQEVILAENEVISLSNLQHLEFLSIDGEYLTVLFNSNFYCIYGNDHEVSCSGFLFNGSSHVVRFMLNESERRSMEDVSGIAGTVSSPCRTTFRKKCSASCSNVHYPKHAYCPPTG